MVRGPYLRDKNTCARTSIENVGGAYTQRGAYMQDATVHECLLSLFFSFIILLCISILPTVVDCGAVLYTGGYCNILSEFSRDKIFSVLADLPQATKSLTMKT